MHSLQNFAYVKSYFGAHYKFSKYTFYPWNCGRLESQSTTLCNNVTNTLDIVSRSYSFCALHACCSHYILRFLKPKLLALQFYHRHLSHAPLPSQVHYFLGTIEKNGINQVTNSSLYAESRPRTQRRHFHRSN